MQSVSTLTAGSGGGPNLAGAACPAEPPIQRITTPAGDPAWLVTGYELAQELFAHEGLGRSHPDPARAPRYSDATLFGRPWGDIESERAEHARLRRVLARSFSARRMEAIKPLIDELIHDLLAEMSRQSPPVDFHDAVSFPLPALAISVLLGVPAEDREQFRVWSDDWTHMMDDARARSGMSRLREYMTELVRQKRQRPKKDVISDLLAHEQRGELTEAEVIAIATTLLFAGHETTVAAINKGVILLLSNPEQRRAVWSDPDAVPRAVEEILRSRQPLPQDPSHSTVGILRYAHRDMDVADARIRTGDMVLISKARANQDPLAFPDPERFDIDRDARPHLAFGWGPHYCPGAPLARIELNLLFLALPRYFPNLRLTIPVDRLERRTPFLTARPVAVPVEW